MKKVFKFYSDPSHGWIAVPAELLIELAIAHTISHYSFIKNNIVYLEEDGDATNFVKAFKNKYGFEPTFKYLNSDRQSRIRNYQRYYPSLVALILIELKKKKEKETVLNYPIF